MCTSNVYGRNPVPPAHGQAPDAAVRGCTSLEFPLYGYFALPTQLVLDCGLRLVIGETNRHDVFIV